jgi:hypothetical protein
MVRRRVGIYEYSTLEHCILRVHLDCADDSLTLQDGTCIHRGDPILKLHLWNEHMPAMGAQGPSVAWGRRMARDMDLSLKELARYLKEERTLWGVRVICADMCLGTADKRSQLARIVGRFGFEGMVYGLGRPGLLDHCTQNIMMLLLVGVTNPSTLRLGVLLRDHQRFYLSRDALMGRYYGHVRPRVTADAAVECGGRRQTDPQAAAGSIVPGR